jgi:hypothetical protein
MTRARLAVLVLALAAMAHVGSPDTFFAGRAGPYPVRVSVRLPGVIPGRAQVNVHVLEAARSGDYRVSVRAGQWNVGLAGAPPPEVAAPVAGDPTLYSTELWFMTPTSYEVFVDVDGPSGRGTAIVPTLALATAERTMDRRLGSVLAALAVFLCAGMLTIIGAAVRESVLPPGVDPDPRRRRRARWAMAATAGIVAAALWGGSRWWGAEAADYAESVLYRPFASTASIAQRNGVTTLTLSIRDPRWTGTPPASGRYSALLPDHGKLMHLFAIREPALDAFAHLHPIARTRAALDFDAALPPLPPGRYRVYGDIVHESGYAQTMTSEVDVPAGPDRPNAPSDADDSWFTGSAAADGPSPAFDVGNGSHIVWTRGDALEAGQERMLTFSARDADGRPLAVEPYMGMSAHVAIASEDGSVFAHLHPAGSISMAALQHFADASGRATPMDMSAHSMDAADSDVSIPYAFPKPGRYRMWVQMRHGGRVVTGGFLVEVKS